MVILFACMLKWYVRLYKKRHLSQLGTGIRLKMVEDETEFNSPRTAEESEELNEFIPPFHEY